MLPRVLFGFLPLFVYALATGALRWRDRRFVHHFAVMSSWRTAFYYFAFAKGDGSAAVERGRHAERGDSALRICQTLVFLRLEPIKARSIGGTLLGFVGVLLIARPWSQAIGGVSIAGVLWMAGGSLCGTLRCGEADR